MVFSQEKFVNNLNKNVDVATVRFINDNRAKITYIDGYVLNVDIFAEDVGFKFYTYPDKDDFSSSYVGKMPHLNYVDLYYEINRMSNTESRKKICRYPYFKG